MLGFGMGRNRDAGNVQNDNPVYSRSTSGVSGQSPVPYLFGGVAAMLALIAVALLILACSFWRLSGHSADGNGGNGDGSAAKKCEVWKEEDSERKVVVIMAGDAEPTFLAKPAMHDVSS